MFRTEAVSVRGYGLFRAIMLHYVKKLGRKILLTAYLFILLRSSPMLGECPAQVTQCTCYCANNCDGNFFRSIGMVWQWNKKREIAFSLFFYEFAFHYSFGCLYYYKIYSPWQTRDVNTARLIFSIQYLAQGIIKE